MRRAGVVVEVLVGLLLVAGCLPAGFAERTTHQALVLPTSIAFAPDGRLFVAEVRGTIQTYDSIDDPTPELFADMRDQVQASQDHGLLGIEVDPAWPTRPYIYALYSYDAPVGGTAPTHGVGTDTDPCAFFICPAQGRVARLTFGPDHTMTEQKVLIKDVCFGFGYHGGGGIRMAPDGSLIAAFGDGALPDNDGLGGTPDHPDPDGCNDPPLEGGSLRSQDLRSTGDPTGLSGTIIRIDPDTGAPWPTNPLVGSRDVEARKIIAYGVRNPYRMTLRPGTSELWVADVGSAYAEEINRVQIGPPVENLGWPCFEGDFREANMDAFNRPLCESLYATGGDTKPFYSYCHTDTAPGQRCGFGGGALTAVAFYEGGSYGERFKGALFFADYARHRIRAMLATNGLPDPTRVEDFATGIGAAVDLRVGPGGDLYYVDIYNGRVQRIYRGAPPPVDTSRPHALIATPAAGATYTFPGQIAFSGHATDANDTPLPASSMRWNLNLLHCPTETTCHRHFLDSRDGVASGSFTIDLGTVGREHVGLALEVSLTVTSNGKTDVNSVVVKQTG